MLSQILGWSGSWHTIEHGGKKKRNKNLSVFNRGTKNEKRNTKTKINDWTKFKNCDISSHDGWFDYDEDNEYTVSVTNIEWKFEVLNVVAKGKKGGKRGKKAKKGKK